VFGPQKGASPAQVTALEAGLARLAAVLGGDPGQPGAGAAGGAGYGLARWGAALRSGSDEVAAIAGLDAALAGAGLVITGEGRYDATSGTGKVVGAVRAAARRAGVPTAVVAGLVAGGAEAGPPVQQSVALADLAGGPAPAMADPARWLEQAGQALARGPRGEPGDGGHRAQPGLPR
jgi:glycerate kinase